MNDMQKKCRKTFVRKSECETKECETKTSEKGSVLCIPKEKGKDVYLGLQVTDLGAKGISHVQEVIDMVKQIEEDYSKKVIDKNTMRKRLSFLIFLISKSERDELDSESKKEKALSYINDALVRHGYPEQELRKTENRK